MKYKLLASALNHPDSQHPYRGLFNKRSLDSLAKHENCSLTAFAPVPYAPPFGPHSEFWKVPVYEQFPNHNVVRPRFLYCLPKSLFYAATGESFRRSMERATAETDFDVAHACHMFPDGYGVASISDINHRPMTVTCHGHFLNNYSDLPIGVSKRVKRVLERSDHIFCVSNALARKAEKIVGEDDISTVPIGANPANFPTDRTDELRISYGIDQDISLVLFCGQFIKRKGIAELISALPQLPDDDVTYVFVGHGGELKQKFMDAAKKPDSPSNLRILESITTDELRDWFSMADLFLLPSHAEGRPTVIYEAMASSTAVLSTQIDGVSEQVVDGKTGRLITPGNTDQIVDAIYELVRNPVKLERLGKAGYKRLLDQGWTWEDHANRVVRIHKKILSNSSMV